MSSFIKGLVAGIMLVFVVAGLFGGLAAVLSRGGVSIPAESALVVRLEGSIPEHIETPMPQFFAGNQTPAISLYGLTQSIRKAASDDRVKALVLRCGAAGPEWAKAQEVRWAIEEFKESGKPVWAYLSMPSTLGYYVGSLADHVVMQPESYLNLRGLRAEIMFFKGTLDKVGVEADLVRSGKYKSAGEPFIRTEMSPEFLEAMNETLDEFYAQLLEGIAEGRGEDTDHWKSVLDDGPYTTRQAMSYALVDEILYEDQFYEGLSEAVEIEDISKFGAHQYAPLLAGEARGGGRQVAMLHAIGTITSGQSRVDPYSGQASTVGSETLRTQLQRLQDDQSIAGVILRIDSPGGDAIASEQMLYDVRRLAEEKPLVISMSSLAASGGYYIAAVPDTPIVAYPGTYTGSIGVFTLHLNLRGLYDKLGVSKQILTRGRFAALDSDYKSMSPEERSKLAGYVDSLYDAFLARAAEGRGADVDSIHELAQGRVWIGTQAASRGLVDHLGGYAKAVELIREAAEIGEDEDVRVVHYPLQRSLFEMMLSGGQRVALRGWLDAPGAGEVYTALSELSAQVRALGSGPAYRAPYLLTVQ